MKIFIFLLFLSIVYADVNTIIYARFLLNEGDLLVDKGKYLEAIDAYESAKEATNSAVIKLDAKIREANVLALYLYKKEQASKILYNAYLKYPNLKRSEYALFYSAMLLRKIDIAKAKNRFKEYLTKYKHGKFYFQAKWFYKRIKPVKKKNVKIKKLKQTPIVRVLLTKTTKATFYGKLYVNNKVYNKVIIKYKNSKLYFNGKNFYKLKITSNFPIYFQNENKKYYGKILLIPNKGKIYVINYVDITHYLYGVVTSESISSWNIEALKSQAVASRSFVYYQMQVRKNWLYDVRDDTFDQVYKGINGITKKAIKATNDTKGEILVYNNKVILAQFTANSGWQNSSSKEIFNTYFGYLLAHNDNFSVKMPFGKWIKKIDTNDLSNNFKKLGLDFGKIIEIKPFKKVKSGRIIKVKIIGTKGSKVLRTYSSLKKAAKLKDILIKRIEKKGNFFIFYGGGFGHGVGYSQWGAQNMAKNGYNYKEILAFYYKNTQLKKLW